MLTFSGKDADPVTAKLSLRVKEQPKITDPAVLSRVVELMKLGPRTDVHAEDREARSAS
jgi:hypothetical protein